MDASDIPDRRLWNGLRVLLYGVAALGGTLGVAVGVLYLVAALPAGLPLFLVFLFVGILAIVATPSVVAWLFEAASRPTEYSSGTAAANTAPPATCDCSCGV